MVKIQTFILPGIGLGVIIGILSFYFAYNFYPQKNVNINFNEICYEFLDSAYLKYKDLDLQKTIMLKKLQLNAIGKPNNLVLIIFSGLEKQVNELISISNIQIFKNQSIGDNSSNNKKIILEGVISNGELKNLIDNIYGNTSSELYNQVLSSNIGIKAKPHISEQESIQITKEINQFMKQGLKKIIEQKEDVKNAECRSKIIYLE